MLGGTCTTVVIVSGGGVAVTGLEVGAAVLGRLGNVSYRWQGVCVGEGRRRYAVPGYIWAYMQRRWYYLTIIAFLIATVAILLMVSSSLPDYGKNLSLNVAADLIGTIAVLFLIAPFIERAELRRDSVLERFDHRAFIRQAADARHRILILELWTDLLQGEYERPFLKSIREALAQDVEVRMLLLDPDASAAEQRADDLRRQTNVVDNIMANLRCLHEFVHDLPVQLAQNIKIRVYSALPPVQMYRVDDRVVVSFYPVNVTSWSATQYQTNPRAQLGTFVGTKFDELWEAGSTRTLDQFRTVTIMIDTGVEEISYRVQFVTLREGTYVSGQEIVTVHLETGIDRPPVRVVSCNSQGEQEVSGLHSLVALGARSQGHAITRELFGRKYGPGKHQVILKLVERPLE